jgi:hypothetical protein
MTIATRTSSIEVAIGKSDSIQAKSVNAIIVPIGSANASTEDKANFIHHCANQDSNFFGTFLT